MGGYSNGIFRAEDGRTGMIDRFTKLPGETSTSSTELPGASATAATSPTASTQLP